MKASMETLLEMARISEKEKEKEQINNNYKLKILEKWCHIIKHGNKQFRVPVEETQDGQRGRSRSPRRAIAFN